MDSQRAIAAQRRAEAFGVEALLVNAVPRFVKDAEEGLVEKARVVARRDAAVAGADGAAKRMRRHIQSAGFEIEPDRRRRGRAEDFLQVDGKARV